MAIDPQIYKTIKDELYTQFKQAYGRLDESAMKFTQYIFIVNAGGSAATLAFLGTKTGSTFAFWPLLFFAAGVIACGAELLASFYLKRGEFDAAFNRKTGLSETNKIEDLYPEKEKMKEWTSYRIADRACPIAFGLFIAGVLAGGIAFWYS